MHITESGERSFCPLRRLVLDEHVENRRNRETVGPLRQKTNQTQGIGSVPLVIHHTA